MTTFEQRERAAETGFALEQASAFRVTAHRNRLLARWAAIKMGLPAEHAERYAADFAGDEFVERDINIIVARLRDDLLAHGVVVSLADIHLHLQNFGKIALKELFPGAP
ncbi:MAG: DUF1476 domain-containing protein [Stellaceae bacterium]